MFSCLKANVSRGFCYSSSKGLGWSVNQVQWSKWKLGKKLCVTNSGHMAGPQRLHPGGRGECARQGPAGARTQGMEVMEAARTGACLTTQLSPVSLAPLRVGPSLPGVSPPSPPGFHSSEPALSTLPPQPQLPAEPSWTRLVTGQHGSPVGASPGQASWKAHTSSQTNGNQSPAVGKCLWFRAELRLLSVILVCKQ